MNFRPRPREEPEINLIPFIDVLLVVLIFLMMTTTYNRFNELQLQLPVANADAPPQRAREIVVSITSDGRYAVGAQPLAERGVDAVAAALTAAAEGAGVDSVVVISADAASAHQSVITVLEAARRTGLTRLTFATQTAARSGS